MIKVLLTGSSGLIGAACRRTLEARGVAVIAPSSADLDLFDDAAVRACLARHQPTHLLHAAWLPVRGDVMHSIKNIDWGRQSLSLVRAFHDAGGVRAACIGSSAEYDWTDGICRIGTTPFRPATAYGTAKHALHMASRDFAGRTGLSFVWPRIFDLYGPGEHPTRLSSYVLQSVLSGQPAELSHGSQVRDYMYVDDAAEGLIAALLCAYDGDIDIASGVPVSVRELATEIARQAGREDLLRFGARPVPAHDPALVLGNGEHAHACINWRPRFSLEAGVARLVAWGRQVYETRSKQTIA